MSEKAIAKNLFPRGRKELQEIIETCDAVEERKINPFLLDITRALGIASKYYRHWEKFEDHCLDAKTINKLSTVVRLQNSQLKFQSSSLYSDPEFLTNKFKALTSLRLAEVLVKSWHPLVELEQLTEPTIKEAVAYWNNLTSFEERLRRIEAGKFPPPKDLEPNELFSLGLAREKDFLQDLEGLWAELKKQCPVGKLDYWKFVRGRDLQETLERAYLTSFLVTYGYAELNRAENELYLAPNAEPRPRTHQDQVSLPISIPSSK